MLQMNVRKLLHALTGSIIIMVTALPRKDTLERSKHVVERPCYDHIVVDAANERDDNHSCPNT